MHEIHDCERTILVGFEDPALSRQIDHLVDQLVFPPAIGDGPSKEAN
jgi:hypothetical protein